MGELKFLDQIIPVDAKVIRWDQEGGLNGYVKVSWKGKRNKKGKKVFEQDPDGSNRFDRRPYKKDNLLEEIRYAVFHHSVTISARNTEMILRKRNLSVHLCVDPDGTIYQLLDLSLRDRSSGLANDRGIGVEVTNYVTPKKPPPLGYENRPIVEGVVQGRNRKSYDYTPQQKETCIALAAALCSYFPRMAPVTPPFLNNSRVSKVVRGGVWGIIGHMHIGKKWDPGPGFPFIECEHAAKKKAADRLLKDKEWTARDWQMALQVLGYELRTFGSDDVWGEESAEVLEKYRNDINLDFAKRVTGETGDADRGAMEKSLKVFLQT